jgi:hypothetical protein
MEHRGPEQYSEAKSKGLLGMWEIGLVDEEKAYLVDETCANTRTPKMKTRTVKHGFMMLWVSW